MRNATKTEIAIPNNFFLVEASKINESDKFLSFDPYDIPWGSLRNEYEPDSVAFVDYLKRTKRVEKFMEVLKNAIKNSPKCDFYCQAVEPSIKKAGKFGISDEICFVEGAPPAYGHSPRFWRREAKGFNPEKNSRLGTKTEYILFLGTIVKKLIEIHDVDAEIVWYALTHNRNLLMQKCKEKAIPITDSIKILDDEKGGFVFAGKSYPVESIFDGNSPVIDFVPCELNWEVIDKDSHLGWIVLDK